MTSSTQITDGKKKVRDVRKGHKGLSITFDDIYIRKGDSSINFIMFATSTRLGRVESKFMCG